MKGKYDCCILINCINDASENLYQNIVYDKLSSLLEGYSISPVFKEVPSPKLFFEALNEVENKIKKQNLKIWIHLFSHGNEKGLVFDKSHSLLLWNECAEAFSNINKSLENKLFINLTCCKGINIIKMLETSPNSFFEIIASTEDLTVKDAFEVNEKFYKCFLNEKSVQDSYTAIQDELVENGIKSIRYFNSFE